MIEVEELGFSYLGAGVAALEKVSLEIGEGTVTAVVGANGAGKSTLCYALAGFVPHFFKGDMQGSVKVNGKDTRGTPLAELVTQVGLVLQNPFNQISGAKLTVFEEVAFGLENLGVPHDEMKGRVDAALDLFGLTEAAGQSPFALSGGQQQRLALAAIFVMEPAIMVLDEPTAQLDPAATREVMEVIARLAERGRTVVLVDHKLEWVAELASRVIVLKQGRVVADGEPQAVLERAGEWGLIETRYAQASEQVRSVQGERGVPLPQTLTQAVEWFR